MRYGAAVAAPRSDIAAPANLSVATASRALNGRPGVSEAARRSVLAAVDVLGYQRPPSLQARRVGLIGVVIAELDNPVFPLFAQAVERALPSFGYSALLATRQLGLAAEQGSIDLLREHGVAGMIFVSGLHSDTLADTAQYLALREHGIPLAFVNGFVPDLDASFVADDDAAGMALAVAHLAALGHRRIGLTTGPTRYTPSLRKVKGFSAAVDSHPSVVGEVYVGDYSVEGGRLAAVDLVARGCTALVCASDFIALGAIRGVRSLGLTVPADVSIVGYDGAPIMAFTDPPLTTVRQLVDQLAAAAVRALVDEIDGTPHPRLELLFNPELVVRESTHAAPARSPEAWSR